MVFAKRKLIVWEDVLAPGPPTLTLEYRGPNPQNIYEEVRRLMLLIFKAAEDDLQEREFFWDRSRAEERFKVRLELTKDLDEFTFLSVSVDISGFAKPSEEFGKEGAATVQIYGRINAEYPQDTTLQKVFGSFFIHRTFKRRREEYRVVARERIHQFHDQLRSFLNLLPKRG
jgi:hypothetical protein